MAFNEADMEVLHTAEAEAADGKGMILARLFSWKGGPPKISMVRQFEQDDEQRYGRLGSVSLSEVDDVIECMRECVVEAGMLAAKDNKRPGKKGHKKVVKKRSSKPGRKSDRE